MDKYLNSIAIFIAVLLGGISVVPVAAQEVLLQCPAEPTDQEIGFGDSVFCSLETQGDIDIFRFHGSTGDQIIMKATRTSASGGVACLELFDPSMGSVDSQCGITPLSISVTLETDLVDSGLYTALFQAESTSSTFDYTIVLERTAPISPASEAVKNNDSLNRDFEFAGDVDLYHFPGVEGDSLIIRITRISGSGGVPCIDLFSSSGSLVDSACGESPTSSSVTIEPVLAQSGNHIIRTSTENPGSIFSYELMLVCVFGDCPISTAFKINAGLNDAWFNPATNGQGFLITVFPDSEQMFLAWFTFDTERPPQDVIALLGEPGHRWLTAQGPYDGDTANLTIFVTEGGVFDAAQPAASTDQAGDGTMMIEFADCNEGLVTYEITSLDISGEIPIQRIALDNVPLCESLASP